MNGEVSLTIAIKVERSQRDPARDRLLEDACIDGSSFVDRKARSRDIQRNQFHNWLFPPEQACTHYYCSAPGLHLDVLSMRKDPSNCLPKHTALL